MACSGVKEIAVFAQTNLGTRIAIAVSPETTVRDFKSEPIFSFLEFICVFIFVFVFCIFLHCLACLLLNGKNHAFSGIVI